MILEGHLFTKPIVNKLHIIFRLILENKVITNSRKYKNVYGKIERKMNFVIDINAKCNYRDRDYM